ncbi:MAG: hypothetical protein NTW33_01035 [Methanoregula sp.]|nr:hypothetical protein [Methanoregula sp.]
MIEICKDRLEIHSDLDERGFLLLNEDIDAVLGGDKRDIRLLDAGDLAHVRPVTDLRPGVEYCDFTVLLYDTTRPGVGLCVGGTFTSPCSSLLAIFSGFCTESSHFYRRYMGDFVILTKTHRQLRPAVRRVHKEIAALGLRVHVKKRFIGRTTAGCDLHGYRLHPVRRLRTPAESVRRPKRYVPVGFTSKGFTKMMLWQVFDPMVQLAVGQGLRTREQKTWGQAVLGVNTHEL